MHKGAFTYYVSREGGGRWFVLMLTLVIFLMGNNSNLADGSSDERGGRGLKWPKNC